MVNFNCFCLVTLVFLVSANSCWVFNNVNSDFIRELDIDYEDVNNEIKEIVVQAKLALIFPGTKWCGAGNIAEGYEDLGPSADTDKCCREHDHCPDLIEPGETKHNLTNEAFYTRLSCQCDMAFRTCLRKVNSKTSTIIGKMYFNAIGTKCYRKDYPVIGCKRKGGWLNSKCLEYEYNTQGDMVYQWFDVPNYFSNRRSSPV